MGSFNCNLPLWGKTQFPPKCEFKLCPFYRDTEDFTTCFLCFCSQLVNSSFPLPEFTNSFWPLIGCWILVRRQLSSQVFPPHFYSLWKNPLLLFHRPADKWFCGVLEQYWTFQKEELYLPGSLACRTWLWVHFLGSAPSTTKVAVGFCSIKPESTVALREGSAVQVYDPCFQLKREEFTAGKRLKLLGKAGSSCCSPCY